jgi:hypothetical protein
MHGRIALTLCLLWPTFALGHSNRLQRRVRHDSAKMQAGTQTHVAIVPARAEPLTLERRHQVDPFGKGMYSVPALWEAPAHAERVKVGVVAPISLRHAPATEALLEQFIAETTFVAVVHHADRTTTGISEFPATGLVTAATIEVALGPGLNRLEVSPRGSMPGHPARSVEIFRRLGQAPP